MLACSERTEGSVRPSDDRRKLLVRDQLSCCHLHLWLMRCKGKELPAMPWR